jgi:DNA-binding NarL/FixJ family response regulator
MARRATTPVTIRVLIADDHNLFRAGVRGLLRSFGGIDVIGEASDGNDALAQAAALKPDVLLMDVGMPGLNGIEATARVRAVTPATRVVILSMHTGEEHVLRALKAGATGYLLKDAQPDELERAVRQVARGEPYLSPAVSKYVVETYANGGGGRTALDRLTSRQREVLQLIAEGHSSKQIAQILNSSLKTVDSHRTNIMERLGIHNVPGLVRYAIRHGLVSIDK